MPRPPEIDTPRALAVLGPPPAAEQQLDLLLPADQRRLPGAERLETALERALAPHRPSPDGFGEAPGRQRAEILVVEETAGEPARARVDHDAVRLGEGLQPRREVRGLSDHGLLLRGARPDQVAHH